MDAKATSSTKRKNFVAGIIIVLLSFLVSTTGITFFLIHRDTIYNGVTIENMDMGGLSIAEARKKAEERFEDSVTQKKILLKYGDKVWSFTGEDIGYDLNFTKAVNEAYNIGREGNYFERLQKIISLYRRPENIMLTPVYDQEKIEKQLSAIKKSIDKPAKNAIITRTNGKFAITPEITGLQMDIERANHSIIEAILDRKNSSETTIELPVEVQSPRITSESLSYINDLLGVYTTQFNAGNKNRSQNIILSSNAINGTVLMPNDVFSFNERVGPRSRERGYQDAPVIFKGELVEGLGGGVCQVSSTIYNSVLMSNLKIVERVNHSIPSTYVPKGLDATVSYGVLDFKFQNTFSQPIYIESSVHGNQLTIRIYGLKTDNRLIKIETKETEVVKRGSEIKYDANLLQGMQRVEQEGRDGYKITTYKVLYENGVEVERNVVSKDYYRPQKQIIVKGTKKPQPVKNSKQESANTVQNNIEPAQ
ncbi:VanW family protein [Geosporobacter ferrireducens]|uniref:G5 domain-containing protein n=1 Tax=Geosporobacter ferrireducens TaxID=1424294 RepID=A0A1D8GN69_9FIRM|nr:VanW family protein [Geosporobacter ferrireducens]AOT72369.1 hypothetical protein Gferi_24160 [Geosporobacter ferrireducens]MTI56375.1 hypothetical protein [Geosporobacter ferrireducens]